MGGLFIRGTLPHMAGQNVVELLRPSSLRGQVLIGLTTDEGVSGAMSRLWAKKRRGQRRLGEHSRRSCRGRKKWGRYRLARHVRFLP